ncbi:hypothetical protein HOLleu_21256 [Holothuria leucospilota]|uniref:Integrase zinc-binding domain-containing protein n=1 Tax=Holothuria leucospilota TaxID=206669 RepID=A0A9Q1H5W6_HOLLE|nr:hypothetical protein HOLleu_21256 [Holothuria leucospilota]
MSLPHEHKLTGHFKSQKIVERVSNNYYWSGYVRDMNDWCRKCDLCSSRKGSTKKAKANKRNYAAGDPMQGVVIDI